MTIPGGGVGVPRAVPYINYLARPEPVFLSVAASKPVFGGQVHENPVMARKTGFWP